SSCSATVNVLELPMYVGKKDSQKTSFSALPVAPQALTPLKKSALSENYATKLSQNEKKIIEKLVSTGTTTLNIGYNNISSEGAKAIAEALKTNQTLTTLYMYDNKISDGGAKAIAEALKTNQTLTTLDIRSNNISDEGAKAIAEALKKNKVCGVNY
ncbi:unnamed protein product, partial [Didymodactylos carnosus]